MPDLHPLVVHFPIALLILYAVLECLRFQAVASRVELFYTKTILVVAGTLGGLVAAQFGENAEQAYRGSDVMNIIELHSSFAGITNFISGIISILYIAAWISRTGTKIPYKRFFRLSERITDSGWMIPLALLTLIAISITGAFGGSIVYGPDADPFVQLIYKIFVR